MHSARSRTNLAVSHLAFPGLGPLVDRGYGRLHEVLVHGDVETDLPEESADLLCPVVSVGVSLLSPLPENF
jgi:hypothetical protein